MERLTRRTRIVVAQSKNGCITCKERRIKCDETLPTCLRCLRANKTCLGYPGKKTPEVKIGSVALPLRTRSPEQALAVQIVIHSLGSSSGTWNSFTNVWTTWIPQIALAAPCVGHAAAAFGSVYVAQRRQTPIENSAYSKALSELKSEIDAPSCGLEAMILACVLLCMTELIQRRQQNALAHLRGAMVVFKHLKETSKKRSSPSQRPALLDDLESLIKRMDFQYSCFTWDVPHLPSDVVDSHPSFSDFPGAVASLFSQLHCCYAFITSAVPFQYTCRRHTPQNIVSSQSVCIARLSEWLKHIRHALKSGVWNPNSLVLLHCLRAQSTATLIIVSTMLSTAEQAFDAHLENFELIIVDASFVLRHRETQKDTFSPEPGIVQPLQLTALKCRDSRMRRSAIDLLKQAGRDGPFSGEIAAAVCLRAAEIEETQSLAAVSSQSLQHDILELARLRNVGVDAETATTGCLPQPYVGVTFRGCPDPSAVPCGSRGWGEDEALFWSSRDEIVPLEM